MSPRQKIVVFGSSTCKPDSDEYRTAEELGALLAGGGFDVTTGGYSGVMEAVSKGASKDPSAVVCPVYQLKILID